jgi:PAS domain S-box-containing protein
MTSHANRRDQPQVDSPGFAGNSDIFFAAVALTRMPMIVSNPNLPDNPVAFANKAFCELTGYAPEHIIGRNCRFLQGEETDRATIARVRQALLRRTDIAVEVLNYRRDGTPFWNALFISPVFAPDGGLLYFFASQLDVTRRRDAERALAQAQRLEGLGSLAGGMAHEFNNLLTVIRGNLEPLLAAGDAETRDHRLGERLVRVRDAAERAATLTNAMITFARRSRLEDQRLDLVALLARQEPSLRTLLGPQIALAIDTSAAGAAPEVLADPEQLQTAVTNILLNAREAIAASGRVLIELRERRSAAGLPAELVLTVQDDGCGMSPAIAARALDPFFTTKPPGAGAGLGLSMAYGFMRQTGGRLELQSREGQGTAVRLVFPIKPALGAHTPPARPGERIMVVDDDLDLREQAATILGELGYQVLVAATPIAALSALHAGAEVDLLLTDLAMPEMDGESLARHARVLRPRLRVLMTTGFPPAQDSHKVVPKPYGLAMLAARVRETLDDGSDTLHSQG